MNLLDILNALGAEVERKIIDLNSGGCCVFAAAVAKYLPVDYHILVGDPYNEGETIDSARFNIQACNQNKNTVRAWNDNGVCFGHVIIEFVYEGQNYHYDSNGVIEANGIYDPAFGFPILEGELTFEEAKALAKDAKGWNSTFDRAQIPQLRRIVKRYMNKINAV